MPGIVSPPSGIIKPFPWPVDPLATAAPELWRAADLAVPFWASGGEPRDLAHNRGPEAVNQVAFGPDVRGVLGRSMVFDESSTTSGERLSYAPPPSGDSALSAAAVVRRTGTVNGSGSLIGHAFTVTVSHFVLEAEPEWRVNVGGTLETSGSLGAVPLNTDVLLVGRWGSGAPLEVFMVEIGTGEILASSSGSPVSGTTNISQAELVDVGTTASRARSWTGPMWASWVWRRRINDSDVFALAADPFAPFRPAERRVLVTAAAGGDTNVEATTATLTLTEQQATVSLDVNVQAATASLTLTEQQATVNAETNVTASTASLTLTEQAASVSLGVIVGATTDSLTLTEQAAAVSLDVNVEAATDELTLTTFAATVAGGLTIDIEPPYTAAWVDPARVATLTNPARTGTLTDP